MAGKMAFGRLTNEELKNRWTKKDITKEEIFDLMHEYEQGVAEDNYK